MADSDDSTDPDAPIAVFGIPIRLDATLATPGEIWLERHDGEAVRLWPPIPLEDSHND